MPAPDPDPDPDLLSLAPNAGAGSGLELSQTQARAVSDRQERELVELLDRFKANVGDAQQFDAALQRELAALEVRLGCCSLVSCLCSLAGRTRLCCWHDSPQALGRCQPDQSIFD